MQSETLHALPEDTRQNIQTVCDLVEDITYAEGAYIRGDITHAQYVATLDQLFRSIQLLHL
jgi:hypothetical protein